MPKFFATYLRLLVTISALAITNPGWAQTYSVSGDVSGTWTSSNSPYYISGNISVPSGSTLTISLELKFDFRGIMNFLYTVHSLRKVLKEILYILCRILRQTLYGVESDCIAVPVQPALNIAELKIHLQTMEDPGMMAELYGSVTVHRQLNTVILKIIKP